ncbi:TIGR02680 family protein [Kitasatospora purpeofusca]|uniref:TIGR02680 family protein n=1 Tax=Kitasatospora purpeofusca TaxID=67352 RepID=UPI002E14F72D|nr:TIGR02680 family protein [Kitasatospora purpeofusca]
MTTPSSPTPSAALQRILSGEFPIPERNRFQPLRLGLIGIWEYEAQEFVFYRGRLILRGRNGSGKTKVMEATSPLHFDAILNARRLDPFGSTARTMKDNLLHRGREQRVGYSWCEYGRITEDGSHEYVTIGLGMRASTAHKGIMHEPWFFVTSKRVGKDFQLLTAKGKPLLRGDLEKELDASEIFSERRAYRSVVARTLFGFNPGRLHALVEALLALRRPKLSENFDGEKLSRMLSEGLPPVSAPLLDDLALRFDQLTRDRNDLKQQERHQTSMRSFLTTYTRFARHWARHLSEALVSAEQILAQATADSKKAQVRLASAAKKLDEAVGARDRLAAERESLETAVGELRAGPLMKEHGLLVALQQQAEEAAKLLPALQDRKKESDKAVAEATAAEAEAVKRVEGAFHALTEAEAQSVGHASVTKLEDVHRQHAAQIRTAPEQAEEVLLGSAQARSRVLTNAVTLAAKVTTSKSAHDVADKTCQTARLRWTQSQQTVETTERAVGFEVQELRSQLTDWSERCLELRLTEQELTDLHALAPSIGLPSAPTLSQALSNLAQPRQDALAQAIAALKNTQEQQQGHRTELLKERHRVEQERDPLPPPPCHVRRDRIDADDGAPLWQLIDFVPELPHDERTGLEASLLGSGLLDAWITADGKLLADDLMDTVLLADRQPITGRPLTHVLRAVDHPAVTADVTGRILASVALAEPGTTPPDADWIACDGSWRIGPAQGRTTVAQPAYIGAAARAAERQRRISLFDQGIAEVDELLQQLGAHLRELAERRDDLNADCSDAAELDQKLRAAQQTVSTAREVFRIDDAQLRDERAKLEEAETALNMAVTHLDQYARQQGTATTTEALAAEQQALLTYQVGLATLFRRVESWSHHTQECASAHRMLRTQKGYLERAVADLEAATATAEEKRVKYETRRSTVGKDVDAVLKELSVKEAELATAKRCIEGNQEETDRARETHGRRQAEFDQSEALIERSRASVEEQEAAYRRLERLGFTVLAGAGTHTESEPGSTAERARTLLASLQDEPYAQSALDQVRDEVDAAKQSLELELAGQDWRVRSSSEDRLVTVRLLHNGRSLTITEALAIVDAEVHERTRLLSESEHNLFTQVLLGRLGEHLRQRRARAKSLIQEMNRLLALRKTASGQSMRLVWEADPKKGPKTKAALETLDQQSSRFLPDASRQQLIDFLDSQVISAREEIGGADWKTHLRTALDYRTWSRIRVQYKPGPQQRWVDIDAGMHGKGSGGEKAVMLQLPLFVAAAAHYSSASPTAPRPVYLDEAFAGIDSEMRGECMGLLVQLDLDFVMASHDEWGFYEEVPGLANYQLFRNPDVEGVLTTPTIWDGGRRHLMVDPALLGGSAVEFGDDEDDDVPEDGADEEFSGDENGTAQGDPLDEEECGAYEPGHVLDEEML